MGRWIVSAVIGCIAGIGMYAFLLDDVFLCSSFAICWMVIPFNYRYVATPQARYASGMLILVATLGVSSSLEIPREFRIALRLLVISVGWACIALCTPHKTKKEFDPAP